MTHQLLPAMSRRLGFFTALVSLALTSPSLAQSVWTGSANNMFSDGANWSPTLPGTADAAIVDTGSTQVDDTATIDRLDVGGGNVTITNTGTLTVTNGSTITSGSIGINADGTLNSDVNLDGGSLFIDGTLNGRLTLNNGNVAVNGALTSATVEAGTTLSNNGAVNDVSVSSQGTFTNNGAATLDTLNNAGTASNAGTIGNVTNTDGNFTNNVGGTVTGKIVVSGGTVTNNFVVTDADVAAAAAFYNNNGATAGNIRNSGTVVNAGTVASLQNDAGSFTNNAGGSVTGLTTVSGGTVTNNFIVTDADVAAAAAFVNNAGATADNVKSGGTVTNSGTISSVENDGGTLTNTTGASIGSVINAGSGSNAGTIGSLANMTGDFTNNASGEITGNTTVSGGRVTNNFVVTAVDVAAAAAFVNNGGATAGAVKNSGTTSNAGTIASLQNDDGLFTNNAGGTVTGDTRIAGGVVVNNAVLADVDIGTEGRFTNNSGATAGAVTNSGNASNDGTIASLINNDGVFSNTGTISGAVTVTGGELTNQGTVTGTISVFDGGLLSGTGVAGGLTVGNGGILSPGPGLQTLHITGNVVFDAGAIYRVDIDEAGFSDRLAATGTVDLGNSTLDIRAASPSYALTTDYTIVTAAAVNGKFGNVVSDFAFLSPTLTYDPTIVSLHLDRNSVRFQDVAQTVNDRVTAAAVENLGSNSTLYRAVLPLDVSTAASAFSQLNGEVHASLKSNLLWETKLTREAIIDQMNAAPGRVSEQADEASFWTTGVVAQNNFADDGTARGTGSSIAGTLIGGDAPVSDTWRLGGVMGYSNLSTQPDANADSYHLGLYAAGDIGPLDFIGGTIATKNDISTRRNIAFGAFTDRPSANYAGTTAQIFGDIAWTFEINDLSIQPFANHAYVNLDTEGFTEDGGAAALTVSGGSSDVSISTLGMRWTANIRGGDLPVVASGMLGWRHAAGDLAPISISSFGGNDPFILEGVTMPRDAMVIKAGITAEFSKDARFSLTYAGEFGSGFSSNAAYANLSVNF
ncbi:autotransporter outer membrane beta-barrel domain-containing protein [Agrobacterium vaccinii]|uniref:autotransporter outer membrane beta-barrel domain-containing protein n=1 Tax=Agrobacterium vaccinii TaxID=2735528 RepID=UPI001E570FCA|nr:autotransporter domain-containing protein [Agrobacterium vaccinii]UHS58511.1 autotransporter domain-containing protein [Agrobacterium vaccinii]